MNTNYFKPIKLEEMDKVKLMNRIDKKYWFHIDHLQELFYSVKDEYYVLSINSQREIIYSTTYYDTQNNKMYTSHHNGKLNRYKIRCRTYVSSGISFLEVKFKNNKGRTIKKRIPTSSNNQKFNSEEEKFLKENSPYYSSDLNISLINKFSRITLVNKEFCERCTIDFNIEFNFRGKSHQLKNLVIVEIKTDGNPRSSSIAKYLQQLRIKSNGFSKYCVGRTILDPNLKHNIFKEKIRKLEKLIHSEIKLTA